MRWKYFTPGENPEEDDARQRVAARIDAWWDAFRSRADQLERFFNNEEEWDLAGWMREHLQSIDPRLMWEFGPLRRRPPPGDHP